MKWHQDHHSGDTINRINKAASALYHFSAEQFMYITYTVMFVGPLVALAFISPIVALMATASGLFCGYVIGRYDRVLVPMLLEENTREHHFSSAFFDYVSNITTIITLRIGEQTRGELARRLAHIYPVLRKSITLNEFKWFSLTLIRVGIEVAVLMFYIWSQLKDGNALQIGLTVMVYQYLRQLSQNFVGFAGSYEKVVRWRADFGAVDALKADHAALPPRPAREALAGWEHIAIRDINFSYEDKEHQNHQLHDVSVQFKRGERIALVGESGAGKSTLLGLLRGIYPCPAAVVEVDGKPMGQGLNALSRLTTLIPQDPEIFENTIRYNITTGIDHTEDELMEAIHIAGFDTVLPRLEQGVETDIREKGVNLSGGEKQRLALARGVFAARQSSILLLDEPTSSIDGATERRIYERMFAAFPRSTLVSSIHRLHLLEVFDRIYVMRLGMAVQEGSLKTLLAEKSGPFAAMWKHYHQVHVSED